MPPEAKEGLVPDEYASGIAGAEAEAHDGLAPWPRWHGLRWAHPRHRDKGLTSTTDDWLEDRRRLDGAEGLWRVEDSLYDLTPFLDRHPGGREWLELTRGTDVTEAFFTHHVSQTAEALLPSFLVRPASAPRNSPFTFHRDGFYMQLRERARKVLHNTSAQEIAAARQRSRTLMDLLAVSALLTCSLAASFNSYLIGAVGGLLVSLTASAAHNFFHQKHNWRRYYFDLSLMSSREWMVSHALSHHLFPNTIQDLEITFFEPLISFLPYIDKSFVVRYVSWFYNLVLYATTGHAQLAKRLQRLALTWADAVALVVPGCMLLTGAAPLHVWLMWTWVLVVSSFYFAFQGLTAGHHHPDNYHEGDALGPDLDFGLMQLSATASCGGPRGPWSLLLVLTHFGNHRLHHFFPTLDHAMLPLLEPVLAERLAEYRLPSTTMSAWEAVKGKYLQMANNAPNQRLPGAATATLHHP